VRGGVTPISGMDPVLPKGEQDRVFNCDMNPLGYP
jgi:hypothetical protein